MPGFVWVVLVYLLPLALTASIVWLTSRRSISTWVASLIGGTTTFAEVELSDTYFYAGATVVFGFVLPMLNEFDLVFKRDFSVTVGIFEWIGELFNRTDYRTNVILDETVSREWMESPANNPEGYDCNGKMGPGNYCHCPSQGFNCACEHEVMDDVFDVKLECNDHRGFDCEGQYIDGESKWCAEFDSLFLAINKNTRKNKALFPVE